MSSLFDFDSSALDAASKLIGAMPKEVESAFNRAMQRTQVTIQTRSAKTMREHAGAKGNKVIKRRLQVYRNALRLGSGTDASLRFWFGLNDIGVSALKGRISAKRNQNGANFHAATLGAHHFQGGFVAKMGKTRSICIRNGSSRFAFHEAKIDIHDKLRAQLTSEVLPRVKEVFLHHYTADLTSRIAMRG